MIIVISACVVALIIGIATGNLVTVGFALSGIVFGVTSLVLEVNRRER